MCTEQVMYNAISHHLLTDDQPVPEQWSHPDAGQPPRIRTSYNMEYPFGQFKSAVLVPFPPSSFCTPSSLAGRCEKLKSL